MTASRRAAHCAELIIHLARLAQSGETDPRLTPAQWTALRYFARANRFSRTPSAFSSFHATTRGTASQTVKSLVALGLLEGQRSEADGRSTLFELTATGHALLERDPLCCLTAALDGLAPETRAALLDGLRDVQTGLASARGTEHFGTCGDCCHREKSSGGGCYCASVLATVPEGEEGKLCIGFAPRGGSGPA
ncbi:MarR family transcriptional regulator [Maritimibacter sp. 55A14]|nr:MarR family transcriptional regulator [Maritimibacter sp. 55A14]